MTSKSLDFRVTLFFIAGCEIAGLLEELAAGCLDGALELEELVAELLYVDGIYHLKGFEDGLELLELRMIGDEGLDAFVYEDETVGNLGCCLVGEAGHELVNVLGNDGELLYGVCYDGFPEEVCGTGLDRLVIEFLDFGLKALCRLSFSSSDSECGVVDVSQKF